MQAPGSSNIKLPEFSWSTAFSRCLIPTNMANMMLSGSRFAVGSARCVSRRVQPGCIVMRLSASHPAAPLRPKMIRNVLRGLPGRAARRLQPTAAQKPVRLRQQVMATQLNIHQTSFLSVTVSATTIRRKSLRTRPDCTSLAHFPASAYNFGRTTNSPCFRIIGFQ